MAAITPTSLTTSLIFIFILLQSLPSITADPPSSDDSSENRVTPDTNISPTLSVILIVFSALFFLSGAFFVALRKIIESGYFGTMGIGSGGGGQRRPKVAEGLSPAAIELIPTYFYKDVKMHRRVGKGEIECAVCLSQFEDHETLRLLPKCSHVFHPHCVDPWLVVHATCPICRTVVLSSSSDSKPSDENHVITIDTSVPLSPGSTHSGPTEPDQTAHSTGDINSRFTLVLPDVGRARSQTKGLRTSFSWCGQNNRESKPDQVHAVSASHLSDTASGYASS